MCRIASSKLKIRFVCNSKVAGQKQVTPVLGFRSIQDKSWKWAAFTRIRFQTSPEVSRNSWVYPDKSCEGEIVTTCETNTSHLNEAETVLLFSVWLNPFFFLFLDRPQIRMGCVPSEPDPRMFLLGLYLHRIARRPSGRDFWSKKDFRIFNYVCIHTHSFDSLGVWYSLHCCYYSSSYFRIHVGLYNFFFFSFFSIN